MFNSFGCLSNQNICFVAKRRVAFVPASGGGASVCSVMVGVQRPLALVLERIWKLLQQE